jgi:hypothetical protein
MSPKFHAAQGAVGAAVLYPWLGPQALVFGLAVVLIDLDHLIPYVRDCKSLSVSRFFRYHAATPEIPGYLALAWFHTIEFFGLLLALGFLNQVFWVILGACLFHLAFDVLKAVRMGKPFLRAFSFTEYYLRRKNKVTRHHVP